MNVKAAVARAYAERLRIEGLDLDEPRADEILVRLVACGVSHDDLDAIAGRLAMPLPFVPGAQGAGIVERVGDEVTGVETGDAVLLLGLDQGGLAGCRLDGSTPFRSEAGGVNGFFQGQSAFATHVLCAAACAVRLPKDAPLELLAALGGRLLRGAAHGARAEAGQTLVVTGADVVGLAAIMVARAKGAKTIVLADPDAARRDLATEVGATITVEGDDDLDTILKSLVADGAHIALDTTGEPGARLACRDALAADGLYIDADHEPARMVAPRDLVLDLAGLQQAGRLPLDRLVGFYPFDLVNDALDALAGGHVVAPVVRFPLGAFGDLDRAETEGAASEAPDKPAPEEAPADEAPAAEAPAQVEEEGVPAIPA